MSVGAYKDENGILTFGIKFLSIKYFDAYTCSTNYTPFQRRVLGDGTSEFVHYTIANYMLEKRQTSSWYGDVAWFVYMSRPWFVRGNYLMV